MVFSIAKSFTWPKNKSTAKLETLTCIRIKEINFIVRILSNAIGYDKNVLLHDRRFTIGTRTMNHRDVRAHCSDTKGYAIRKVIVY